MSNDVIDTAALASAITYGVAASFRHPNGIVSSWVDQGSGFVGFHMTIAQVSAALEATYQAMPSANDLGLVWLYDVGHTAGLAIGESIQDRECEMASLLAAVSKALSPVICTPDRLDLRSEIDAAFIAANLPALDWEA